MKKQHDVKSKKEKFMLLLDIFFVMLLCFAVLFVTMYFQNKSGGVSGNGYEIKISTLLAVTVSSVVYFVLIFRKSTGQFKRIISKIYDEREHKGEQAK